MAKQRYRKMWIPEQAAINFEKKQKELNRVLQAINNNAAKVPMTKVLIAVSQKPIFFDGDDLRIFNKKRFWRI